MHCENKTDFTVHIRLLQKPLKHAYILRELHKVINSNKTLLYIEKSIKEACRLKMYIHLNTKFRTDSNNDFEKELN